MDLKLETTAHADWVVISVEGELDLYTVPALKDALSTTMAEGSSQIALDLSEVGFMDSSSLGVLVVSLKRAREQGGTLALIGVHGSPKKVLALTGLDAVFTIVSSRERLPVS